MQPTGPYFEGPELQRLRQFDARLQQLVALIHQPPASDVLLAEAKRLIALIDSDEWMREVYQTCWAYRDAIEAIAHIIKRDTPNEQRNAPQAPNNP